MKARLVACRQLPPHDGVAECAPLKLEQRLLRVHPFLSEVSWGTRGPQVDLLGARSTEERRRGWRAASENAMRETGRIERWAQTLREELKSEDLDVVVLGGHSVDDFDRSDPTRFVETFWRELADVNVVATHKYLIVPLLAKASGDRRAAPRQPVDNGSVVETTWDRGGERKRVYWMRHCRSCANELKAQGRFQFGMKATQCLDVEAVHRARCVLRSAVGDDGLRAARLFSSGQPRAMQSGLALLSDAVASRLGRIAVAAGVYTDCSDAQFQGTLAAARQAATEARQAALDARMSELRAKAEKLRAKFAGRTGAAAGDVHDAGGKLEAARQALEVLRDALAAKRESRRAATTSALAAQDVSRDAPAAKRDAQQGFVATTAAAGSARDNEAAQTKLDAARKALVALKIKRDAEVAKLEALQPFAAMSAVAASARDIENARAKIKAAREALAALEFKRVALEGERAALLRRRRVVTVRRGGADGGEVVGKGNAAVEAI